MQQSAAAVLEIANCYAMLHLRFMKIEEVHVRSTSNPAHVFSFKRTRSSNVRSQTLLLIYHCDNSVTVLEGACITISQTAAKHKKVEQS